MNKAQQWYFSIFPTKPIQIVSCELNYSKRKERKEMKKMEKKGEEEEKENFNNVSKWS